MLEAIRERLEQQLFVDSVADIARSAGEEIVGIYNQQNYRPRLKPDHSPLTEADLCAHRCILAGLSRIAPEIPILSEESEPAVFEQRHDWNCYWLVDPLDGTKEFLDRNGEFTVNIALIADHIPIFGVVYQPIGRVMYLGVQSSRPRALKRVGDGPVVPIATRRVRFPEELAVVASRRHGKVALESLVALLSQQFERVQFTNIGSSLKFCLIAEGDADFYPRFSPTCEWDTAAAQVVVEAAGGQVLDMNFNPLRYNRGEDLLNPSFIVIGDPMAGWTELLRPNL